MSVSLAAFSKKELPETLRSLKQYKKMLKEMGNRATMYFSSDMEKNYRSEYDPKMEKSLVESYALSAFQQYFGLKLTQEEVRFIPNPSLISGVRIFSGDEMIDVTFKQIENMLKQF